MQEYVEACSELLRRTPPEVVFHRVVSSARKPVLLAPDWCENRWLAMADIGKNLDQFGAQGSDLGTPFVYHPPVLSQK
jgi:radical SAM superfamily enzyme